MTKFLDGPAADVLLSLRRAPVLLRVVRNRSGEWDALDQLDDEPRPSETIVVYRRVTEPRVMFLDYRAGPKGGRRAGHREESADYRLFDPQPTDAEARSAEAWRAWCERRSDVHLLPTPQAESERK